APPPLWVRTENAPDHMNRPSRVSLPTSLPLHPERNRHAHLLRTVTSRCEAQARPGARRRSIARHILEPVKPEVLDRAGDADPIEDFGGAGVQLVARQTFQ